MGSTISNSAPIAPIVSGVEPAQQPDAGRTSDLQRAYREQCRAALGKRDDGRDCDDTEAQRAHARKKTKRNGEPPGAAGGMPAPHAARDRAFALRFGGARLGEARSGANARDARVGAGAEAGIEAGVEVGTDAHAARGGATMRGHAPASGAVRATSERAPAAATADAHAPQAAAESAPPSVPMPAAHAAPRTSGGSARDIAAAAARICATAADPAAGVVASRSPALPAARGPASATAAASAASAMSAMSSTRRPTAAASPGAARERVDGDGDDSNRAGDASLAGLPRGVQPQASLRAAEPAARAHDPSRAARQRAQAGAAQADARDVRETQGTQVRYSFNSWDGRPAVELRFDAGGAPRVVNAQPSHDRVQRAMEHGADRLSPGWTVEFDRSRADDDSGGRSPWRRARQEPEADER